MNNERKCFVIMPFSKTYKLDKGKWTEIFEHIIKPAVEESGFGYKCERYEFRRANITKDILQELNSAHMVIADLTGSNPNVLWELGVRHTLSKRTILICQDKKFIPSDLKDYPVIPYDQTKAGFDKFKNEIKKKLEDIETNPDNPDSPIADFLGTKNIDLLAYEKSANLRKLDALLSELSFDIDGTDKIAQQLSESDTSFLKLQNTCLKLLLSTRYISPIAEVLDNILLCDRIVDLVNRLPDLLANIKIKETATTLLEMLPITFKGYFTSLLKAVAKIRTDYANDNYQEPTTPNIVLSNPEHEEFIKKP